MSSSTRWCLNRLFEWVMSGAMITVGIHLYLWPGAIGHSSFHFISDVLGLGTLRTLFITVGWFSMLALFANGRWPIWGPRVRAMGAFCRCILWLWMEVALIKLMHEIGAPPSPGIPIYTAMVVGEIIAIGMAASDDRSKLR